MENDMPQQCEPMMFFFIAKTCVSNHFPPMSHEGYSRSYLLTYSLSKLGVQVLCKNKWNTWSWFALLCICVFWLDLITRSNSCSVAYDFFNTRQLRRVYYITAFTKKHIFAYMTVLIIREVAIFTYKILRGIIHKFNVLRQHIITREIIRFGAPQSTTLFIRVKFQNTRAGLCCSRAILR